MLKYANYETVHGYEGLQLHRSGDVRTHAGRELQGTADVETSEQADHDLGVEHELTYGKDKAVMRVK